MNKILVVLLIVQAALAVNSKEFRSKKLAREGTVRKSNVEYIKTNNLRLSMQEGGVHEFFAGEFSTRVDHFRPLNQQRVNFVRLDQNLKFETFCCNCEPFSHFRPTMRTRTTSRTMVHFTFISKTLSITQPI